MQQQRIHADNPHKLQIRCALTDIFVRDISVSSVFFYDRKLDTDVLAKGLARMLGDFAPFNARLRRQGLDHFIECGDAGVSFAVKHSPRTLADTLAQLDDRKRLELVPGLDARGAWSTDTPVFAVLITQFSDGTSALGVTEHHTVGDWSSVLAFLRAWSRSVAGLSWDKPLLIEDRDAYLNGVLPETPAPPNLRYVPLLEMSKLAAYILTKARDKRRVVFYFDPEEVSRMQDTLQNECGLKLSINDVINAHIGSVVSSRDVKQCDRGIATAVDFRRRAQLPENILGNMVTTVESRCRWGTPTNRVAADLRAEVDQFVDKYLNHRANLNYVQNHGGVAKLMRFVPHAIDPFCGSLLLSNFRGLGNYDIDFGGAPPSHYLTASSGPLPWLGVIHEGFGNRGLIVDMWVPRAVAARLLDPVGLREMHRYRDDAAAATTLPRWLS